MDVVLLVFALPFALQAQGVDASKIAKTYYISSSAGDDSNDGLSAKAPKRHISAVSTKNNVCIKLKRNDVFFEQLRDYKNCIIEDYSKGERPVICGFKVLKNPSAWTYDGENGCWKLDLMDERNFTGMIHGEDVKDDRINNVGFIYDPRADKIYGRRVKEIKELTANGCFYITNLFVPDSVKNDTFRFLRWKIDTDPRDLKNLCFPMWLIAVRYMNNCEIRNIAIVGFNFAVVNCYGTLIDNCQIDMIGGAVQLGFKYWVRYGNGIEFSWLSNNDVVKNCLISRTYDCGVSIQSSGDFNGSPENIRFTDNRFYHCRQAFEFFLNPSNGSNPQYVDCSFTGNLCYLMGENEFNSHETRDANILSYDYTRRNLLIERNSFFGAPHFCGRCYPFGMSGNTIYLYEEQYLTHFHAKRNYPSVYANGREDIENYQRQCGDNSYIFILKKGSWKAKRIDRKMRKIVGWKPVELRLK